MSSQQNASLVISLKATAAIVQKRAVSRAGVQANDGTSSAGVNIIGIADENIAVGETGRVAIGPTAMAEAGAVINGSEARLKTDSLGRLIPWTSGSIVAAILKPGQTAAAAGEIVEVIPVLN
jgi:hypothetical protein